MTASSLAKKYGAKMATKGWAVQFVAIETPDNEFKNTPGGQHIFAERATATAAKPGKSQMAPLKQPGDAFVFASFAGYDAQGQRMYSVTLFFSKPT